MQMKNPFQLLELPTTEEEEEQNRLNVIPSHEKHKKARHQLRLQRKLPIESITSTDIGQPETFNEPIPLKIKTFNYYPYMERTKWLYTHKELTQGHYLDRRSGTGREDRPKKSGGGYHSVGNIRDQLNRDKYEKEEDEPNPEPLQNPIEIQGNVPLMKHKAPELPRITLSQYYDSKGVDLASISQYKAPAKKTTIDKQWFKKERLNLVQTKQDLKNQQRKRKPSIRRQEDKNGLEMVNEVFEKLGFGGKSKSEQLPRQEERREEVNKDRPKFSNEDFPAL